MQSINVIKVRSELNVYNEYLDQLSNNVIDSLNDDLFENDLVLEIGAKNALFDLFLVETGGSEYYFQTNLKKLKSPVILLSTQENNSLAACFEIRTFLENHKITTITVLSDDKNASGFIYQIARHTLGVKKLRKTKLGVIGTPSDWLIGSSVDYKKVKSRYGISLVDIDINELYEEVDKKILLKHPKFDELVQKSGSKLEVEKAFFVYFGLKNIIKKYKLNGFTIRCFDLLKSHNVTSCIALSLLNDEGYICGCEGDVPALLTMTLIKALTNQNSFMANPSKIDLENNNILLSHCTCPISLLSSYKLNTHFESNSSLAIEGKFNCNKVTICKLYPNIKEIIAVSGNVIESETLNRYCRTQVKVNLDENYLMELLSYNYGNHVIVTYGDQINDLFSFMSFINFSNK